MCAEGRLRNQCKECTGGGGGGNYACLDARSDVLVLGQAIVVALPPHCGACRRPCAHISGQRTENSLELSSVASKECELTF